MLIIQYFIKEMEFKLGPERSEDFSRSLRRTWCSRKRNCLMKEAGISWLVFSMGPFTPSEL